MNPKVVGCRDTDPSDNGLCEDHDHDAAGHALPAAPAAAPSSHARSRGCPFRVLPPDAEDTGGPVTISSPEVDANPRGRRVACESACEPMACKVVMTFEIHRQGRPWRVDEIRARLDLLPEKFEVFGGRVAWSPEELRAMLGVVLEQAGADLAVSLGDLSVWHAAVEARESEPAPDDPFYDNDPWPDGVAWFDEGDEDDVYNDDVSTEVKTDEDRRHESWAEEHYDYLIARRAHADDLARYDAEVEAAIAAHAERMAQQRRPLRWLPTRGQEPPPRAPRPR